MGMLSQKDLENAILTNLKEWPWDIKPSYPMEKEEAEAMINLLEKNKAQQMMNELRGL